jgi:hypothetical protein
MLNEILILTLYSYFTMLLFLNQKKLIEQKIVFSNKTKISRTKTNHKINFIFRNYSNQLNNSQCK